MKLLATILALGLVAAVAGAAVTEVTSALCGFAVTVVVACGLCWLFREALA